MDSHRTSTYRRRNITEIDAAMMLTDAMFAASEMRKQLKGGGK
jgi:hypothetical protein